VAAAGRPAPPLSVDGRIWNADRAYEGWRPYRGAGVRNTTPTSPDGITGGHYDHVTSRSTETLYYCVWQCIRVVGVGEQRATGVARHIKRVDPRASRGRSAAAAVCSSTAPGHATPRRTTRTTSTLAPHRQPARHRPLRVPRTPRTTSSQHRRHGPTALPPHAGRRRGLPPSALSPVRVTSQSWCWSGLASGLRSAKRCCQCLTSSTCRAGRCCNSKQKMTNAWTWPPTPAAPPQQPPPAPPRQSSPPRWSRPSRPGCPRCSAETSNPRQDHPADPL